MNWKWPAKRGNNYEPWYKILWRSIWVAPMFVSLFIFIFFLACCYGLAAGLDRWRDNT